MEKVFSNPWLKRMGLACFFRYTNIVHIQEGVRVSHSGVNSKIISLGGLCQKTWVYRKPHPLNILSIEGENWYIVSDLLAKQTLSKLLMTKETMLKSINVFE